MAKGICVGLVITAALVSACGGEIGSGGGDVGGDPEPDSTTTLSASEGWLSIQAIRPAFDILEFELIARPEVANIDAMVAVGSQDIADFSDAAIKVRFADDGFIDARDGSVYDSDQALPYEAGEWYRLLIKADVVTETYDVMVGQRGQALRTLITDAAFDSDARMGDRLTTWAAWSAQGGNLDIAEHSWVVSDSCTPTNCLSLDLECGVSSDGCGGNLSCGSCAGGQACDSGVCVDPPSPAPPSCTPATCVSLGLECGLSSDGCGGNLSCGNCPSGQACVSGVCVEVSPAPNPPSCAPATCISLGLECGVSSDGCGGYLSCGSCAGGQACDSGVCVDPPSPARPSCTPATCVSLGLECGVSSDGCGGYLSCGGCAGGQACDSGVCVNVSSPAPPSCTPATCVSLGLECGEPDDGCGGNLSCGGCAGGQACTSGGVCVDVSQPAPPPSAEPPPPPPPAETYNCNSVRYSREGLEIGFEFNCGGGACKCGQFANGWDYWVAPQSPGGTVTITRMTPTPTGSGGSFRNGAQYGPTRMANEQGFDGRFVAGAFGSPVASLRVNTPVGVNPSSLGRPQTIMKAISASDASCTSSITRICLDYVETLTVLDTPPGDVFRPAYFGTNKTMYSASLFDSSILSNVAPVSGSISWAQARENTKSVQPQHYVLNGNSRQGYNARINNQVVRGYGPFSGEVLSETLLKLTEAATGGDVALKEATAKGIAQLGIDLWAIHNEGGTPCGAWNASGGFNQGRLTPILFASALLGQTWETSLNSTMSTALGQNCFGETGFIQPTSVTSSGKNVPLFGHILGCSTVQPGIPCYAAATNCNVINPNWLIDGGHPGCGSPSTYQRCCTHGNWLGQAMAIWLTPAVYNRFPTNAMHWLEYVDRARSAGVSVGADFGSYSDPTNFSVTGFEAGYDPQVVYSSWNTYAACSTRGTQNCAGMTFSP